MYTLDASVFARDFDVRDPEHATCRALLRRLAADATQIVVRCCS
jgi:predicted nucleic acid-binding protein